MEFSILVSIEINLPIGITIIRQTFHIGVFFLVPVRWESLIFLDMLSTTTIIEILWSFLIVDHSDLQGLLEAFVFHNFFCHYWSYSVGAVKEKIWLVIFLLLISFADVEEGHVLFMEILCIIGLLFHFGVSCGYKPMELWGRALTKINSLYSHELTSFDCSIY